ncbi:excinuclease ABC subunit UvrC [Fastidiosibacter lacustris]|uniref:excinuclease ABC subunit UvrC n=1 Tax=Fastidiosibacter lacustris TaxID=2056695 RepID=UPI000E354F0B|nr:excinuclease ABC subunit UvrC [Fastidiosibacter lacustris]
MFKTQQDFDLSSFLKNLTPYPGVYRMYDGEGNLLYVGKAKNLHKRVNSYFNRGAKDLKTQTLAAQVNFIDITVTPSDYEAFLLESALIKKHKPKYNILFKDDKSYPYLYLSDHVFPRLSGFRGKPRKNGQYFGPYVSLVSMKETLTLLQKLFVVRQCEDSYFNNRSRPCLQYQIKRCSAPCVGKISEEAYQLQVDLLARFVSGKLSGILQEVSTKMHQASENEYFEEAARLRDQLILLTKLQQQQFVDKINDRSFHVIGLLGLETKACITVLQVTQGKVTDDKSWIVNVNNNTESELLEAFLAHYYLDEHRTIWPKEIILPKGHKVANSLLQSVEQRADSKIRWLIDAGADNAKWQKLAMINAKQKLQINLQSMSQFTTRFLALAKWLNKDNIHRIECFDISHYQGEATVASCVVFDRGGSMKSAYRRYNIQNITPGDDYAAIAQVLERRIESGIEAQNLPDVIVIDGGKGQLKKAQQVLHAYKQEHNIQLISLGKGVERISGKEDIFLGFDDQPHHLPEHDLSFLLLRQIRDAAHDFAIKGQRKKIAKRQNESVLESIPGVGRKRCQALLRHFGGWQELVRASVEEIAKVKGISHKLADEIWHAFR